MVVSDVDIPFTFKRNGHPVGCDGGLADRSNPCQKIVPIVTHAHCDDGAVQIQQAVSYNQACGRAPEPVDATIVVRRSGTSGRWDMSCTSSSMARI
jgi:hypothetical protein